jgi:hypothetical protein
MGSELIQMTKWSDHHALRAAIQSSLDLADSQGYLQ